MEALHIVMFQFKFFLLHLININPYTSGFWSDKRHLPLQSCAFFPNMFLRFKRKSNFD